MKKGNYYKYKGSKSCYLLSACHVSGALHNSVLLQQCAVIGFSRILISQSRKGRQRGVKALVREMQLYEAEPSLTPGAHWLCETPVLITTCISSHRHTPVLAKSAGKTLPTKSEKQNVVCSNPVLSLCEQIILLKANREFMLQKQWKTIFFHPSRKKNNNKTRLFPSTG